MKALLVFFVHEFHGSLQIATAEAKADKLDLFQLNKTPFNVGRFPLIDI